VTDAERDDLCGKWLPLARGLARRWARARPHLHDELESEACLALVRAARDFNPALGFAFATFARRSITLRFLNLVKRESRHLAAGVLAVDADGELTPAVELHPDDAPPVGHALEVRDELELLYRRDRDSDRPLSGRVLRVFERCVGGGERSTEVAAELNVSRARVNQILARCAERFRALATNAA
jgi:RNA polymerase sigma factor (sigma-70 family)